MPIARGFLRNYFDVVLVLVFIGLTCALTYIFWPNVKPTVCVDEKDSQIPCESTDADGSSLKLTPSVCVNNQKQRISCSYEDARKFIWNIGVPLGAVFSWLVYFFIGQPIRLKEIFYKNDDISSILPISGRSLKKNTILVLGLGHCGKTELIKTLSYGSVQVEEIVTEKWSTYGFAIESYDLKAKRATKHMLFINDYRGQRGGQIASEMQNAEHSDTGYSGHSINAVILMVDLFPWSNIGDEDKTYKAFNADRIEEHLREWSRYALDICFGFLRKGSLKQVFLFINKLDQLENGTTHNEKVKAALEKFSKIHEDLAKRATVNGAEFRCIVGSVRTGRGVLGDDSLVNALVDQSIEINANTVKTFT